MTPAEIIETSEAKAERALAERRKTLAFILDCQWSEFAKSLAAQHQKGKAWSDKQWAAAHSMRAKSEAKDAAKAAPFFKSLADAAPAVDLSPLMALFDKMSEGWKKPIFRAEGLRVSMAPKTGKNAGALYVKADDEGDVYLGKIVPPGAFRPASGCGPEVLPALAKIAADPMGAAVSYGARTGRCACCGALLTNDTKPGPDGLTSVERGIGPICAARIGMF